LTSLSIAYVLVVLYVSTPSGDRVRDITHYIPEADLFESARDGGVEATTEPSRQVPAERTNHSRVLGLTGIALVVSQFVQSGIDALGLNIVNFGFLTIGILIYMDPQTYREKFGEAATAASGIVLLFPFFAGTQGMIASSGLAQLMASGLISLSTPQRSRSSPG
jgi:short-chain fatty acids transporter